MKARAPGTANNRRYGPPSRAARAGEGREERGTAWTRVEPETVMRGLRDEVAYGMGTASGRTDGAVQHLFRGHSPPCVVSLPG